jgi:hypothetical protein
MNDNLLHLSEGSIIVELALPGWPLAGETLVLQQAIEDGTFALTSMPNGIFVARLAKAGTDILQAQSCPITMDPPFIFRVATSWKLPDELTMCIAGEFVASTKADIAIREHLHIPAVDPSVFQEIDYSQKNQSAVDQRRSRLAGHQTIMGRKRAGADYVFSDLNNTINAVSDLVGAISNGSNHHIPGLGGQIRRMIVVGDPLPSLQLAAAFIDAPLLVFTDKVKLPIDKGSEYSPVRFIRENVSAVKTQNYPNPIDLDAWLDSHAAMKGGKYLTHRDILRAYGHSVGSHLDLDIHPVIEMLSETKSAAFGGRERDAFFYYLMRISEVSLSLAKDLIRRFGS